jgi:hypothetical protein
MAEALTEREQKCLEQDRSVDAALIFINNVISQAGRTFVTYSIFCTGVPVPAKCDSMGSAIETACKLINGGSIVSQIKGSDGFLMERSDIEYECLRRATDRVHIR